MKHKIQALLGESFKALVDAGQLPPVAQPQSIAVDTPRRDGQGDYSSAVAMSVARKANMNPLELAQLICEHIRSVDYLSKVEIAPPGFINFFLSGTALSSVVDDILRRGVQYGTLKQDNPERIMVEFVSANPTGPLHVGHGRGTAFGDSLARILRAAGNEVDTEYYVNDIGRQMNILAVSVWIRYLQSHDKAVDFPAGAYQGGYIIECAKSMTDEVQSELVRSFDAPPKDAEQTEDDFLTQWIATAKDELNDRFGFVRTYVRDYMVNVIKDDLASLGVYHDNWFFESQLSQNAQVSNAVSVLERNGFLYQSNGATWFRSSQFGDEKDRVMVRSNGELTYFASDIAYHLDKYKRGYNRMINIWGADHHGYVARMKAAMDAAGEDSGRLQILIVQLASLIQTGQKVSMSTRAGKFVTLRQLVDETGSDAARFFYLLRKCEQHLDFDLTLAKAQSSDNPVYYVQYAHARICSVFRNLSQRGMKHSHTDVSQQIYQQDSEVALIKRLAQYPEVIQSSARSAEPHQIAYYLRDVATDFHSFYNRERILDAAEPLRSMRLTLIDAVRQVLSNGLGLLGVCAPQKM